MLTRRPSLSNLDVGNQKFSQNLGSKVNRSRFLGSPRSQKRCNPDHGGPYRFVKKDAASRASIESRRTSSRASLAYVRSLSKGQRASTTNSVNKSAEKLHVIPYSELILRRKLDGGFSLIDEASDLGDGSVCWEEAWKLYMQSQTANLQELSARVRSCSLEKDASAVVLIASTTSEPPTDQICDETMTPSCVAEVTACSEGPAAAVQTESFLPKLWRQKLGRRRTRSLILLNVLAALYGSSTVAGKFAIDMAPCVPASLSSLVRFSSALVVFLPAAISVIRNKNVELLKAGGELGALLFAATVLETCGDGGASSDAPLLFAFTVIFVPIMELCAGRQSVRNITRIASLVALSGMGVLEEEGFGWKGISIPQVGDFWGLAASAVYALHIFRSEAHSNRFKPFQLTAIQCGTVASLSFLWEIIRVLHENTSSAEYINQVVSLPWAPLVYTGLVCAGLCNWLEICGLRSIHASTATMVNTTIPIWGAFLSFFLRGETLDDSAVVGGLVILAASLFAQIMTKQDDSDAPIPSRKSSQVQTANPGVEINNSVSETDSPTTTPKPAADHVQGAIITSQLKFPYYAAQAKRLLVEAKLKILSVKSIVMSATSSMLMTTPPGPPGTGIHVQQAVTMANNVAPSLNQAPPMTGMHAAVVMQWLEAAMALLESATIALGSDVVQAAEEAEDLATVVEQAGQSVMEHTAMAASSVELLFDNDEFTTQMVIASFDILKSFNDTATLGVSSMNCALPILSHHADAFTHIFAAAASPIA